MKVQCQEGRKLPRLTLLAAFIWFVFCIIAFSNAGSNIIFILLAIPVAYLGFDMAGPPGSFIAK
jgi:hypothetical protein